VSGDVIEVNTSLDDAPEKINADPYGDGWIFVIEMSEPSGLDALMDADAYRQTVE
jgi:glycine cleavage system H protein